MKLDFELFFLWKFKYLHLQEYDPGFSIFKIECHLSLLNIWFWRANTLICYAERIPIFQDTSDNSTAYFISHYITCLISHENFNDERNSSQVLFSSSWKKKNHSFLMLESCSKFISKKTFVSPLNHIIR